MKKVSIFVLYAFALVIGACILLTSCRPDEGTTQAVKTSGVSFIVLNNGFAETETFMTYDSCQYIIVSTTKGVSVAKHRDLHKNPQP